MNHHLHHPQQVISIPEILDDGSISFGKLFGIESLAWEKWLVFSHNQCQEELEKFKALGFVSQKKAYFEEYYKRVRAVNSSQPEKQETIQPDLHQDVRTNTIHQENVTEPAVFEGEKSFGYFNQIRKFESDTSSDFDSCEEDIVDEPEVEASGELLGYYWNNDNEKLNMAATKKSLFTVANHSTKEDFSSPTSIIGSSETAHHESLALSSVENITSMRKKQVRTRKSKGNVTCARKRTNLGCKTRYDAIRPTEKKKPSPKNKNTIRDSNNNSLVLTNQRTSKAGRRNTSVHVSSHRQLSEACSSSTSLSRNRLLTSSPSSKGDQTMADSNHQDFIDNFPRLLSIGVQSVQSPAKERAVLGGLEHKATDNRFTKFPTKNKSNRNDGVELGQRNYVKEKKQKEVWQDKSNVKLGRDAKSATNKSTILLSADSIHSRREQRLMMPSWR